MTRSIPLAAALVLAVPLVPGPVGMAQEMDDVEIRTIEVADGIYMLEGRGGNIGLCVGDDGAFMIDDQFAPLTGRILAAVAAVTDEPVRFLVNTHWHSDHTGGNENIGETGAVIFAHENVRRRMSTEQVMEAFDRTVPAAPPGALPVVTFTSDVTFHLGGEEIHVVHVAHAHTDGDAIIHFRRANVVHMGDVYFAGMYPFIDVGSGGNIDGVIEAVTGVLGHVDDETKFIPGHGAVTGIEGLRDYRRMLMTLRDRIADLIAEGKSREEVIAAKPTADHDEQWGGGFMQPDVWTGIVYDGLTRER
jgi:glyoxylase-like metal-dependent hydrolase (beta-lactamase superfamily II)